MLPMAIKIKLVLLCLLRTVVSYNSGQPLIVLETDSLNQTSTSFTSYYNDMRQDRNKQLLLLDGEDCSENSVSGSLLVSTVKNIRKLNISPSSSQLNADHIAIKSVSRNVQFYIHLSKEKRMYPL